MVWNPKDPIEWRKRIALAVASSSCIETGRNVTDVYNQILEEWEKELVSPESNKTKLYLKITEQ